MRQWIYDALSSFYKSGFSEGLKEASKIVDSPNVGGQYNGILEQIKELQ